MVSFVRQNRHGWYIAFISMEIHNHCPLLRTGIQLSGTSSENANALHWPVVAIVITLSIPDYSELLPWRVSRGRSDQAG